MCTRATVEIEKKSSLSYFSAFIWRKALLVAWHRKACDCLHGFLDSSTDEMYVIANWTLASSGALKFWQFVKELTVTCAEGWYIWAVLPAAAGTCRSSELESAKNHPKICQSSSEAVGKPQRRIHTCWPSSTWRVGCRHWGGCCNTLNRSGNLFAEHRQQQVGLEVREWCGKSV